MKIRYLFLLVSIFTYSKEWSYKDQSTWIIEHGKYQSPININTQKAFWDETYDKLHMDLESKATVLDNGHSINLKGGGVSILNKRHFKFLGMHIHSPSEHHIDGKSYPMEFHFVHESSDNKLGVIGVLVKTGKENQEFQKILDSLKEKKMNKIVNIFFDQLLPDNKSYFHYSGSLTTPPLSEVAEWYVMEGLIEISEKQLKLFNDYYLDNNREIQNLNNRTIIKYR